MKPRLLASASGAGTSVRARAALLGWVLAVGLLPAPLAAQGPIDLASATLEELMAITVTTATRTEQTLGSAPARIEVITADQIQRRGYLSLLEVLADLVDIKVDLWGDPDYPSDITVQGMRGTGRVVIMLDGVRISSPTNEPLPILANYPVHQTRQVEVVYGPASALYGADAFSAVVNIISRTAADASGVAASTAVGQDGLVSQTASFVRALGAAGSVSVAGQWLADARPDMSRAYPDLFGGLQAQRGGLFNTIYGPMSPATAPSPAFAAPLSAHSLQADVRVGGWRATLFESQSQVSTSTSYTPDNAIYNRDAFNRNRLFVGALGYTRAFGGVSSSSLLTMSRHELDPESGYRNVFSNLQRSYKYAYGSMLRFEEQVTWKATPALDVTGGGSVERYVAVPQGADLNAPLRSRDRPGTILGTDIPDDLFELRYRNVGAFAQLQYGFGRHVAVTLGARSDHNTRYGGTFNPRVGVVARPAERTTLKLLYGSAFLAPSPYQAYTHYGSFYSADGGATYASDYWHVPNPDLQPQTKKTIEGNVHQGIGDSVMLTASLFYSRFSDLLQGTDADQAYAGLYQGWPVAYIDFPVNEGQSNVYGGTIGLQVVRAWASRGRMAARAAISLTDGTVREQDEAPDTWWPVGAMAPLQSRFGVDFDWGRWSVTPRLALVGRQRTLALDDGGTRRRTIEGYRLLDLNLRRNELFRGVGAFVKVENALDARYRHVNVRAFTNPEEFAGAPQNPRRVTVGVDVRLP